MSRITPAAHNAGVERTHYLPSSGDPSRNFPSQKDKGPHPLSAQSLLSRAGHEAVALLPKDVYPRDNGRALQVEVLVALSVHEALPAIQLDADETFFTETVAPYVVVLWRNHLSAAGVNETKFFV